MCYVLSDTYYNTKDIWRLNIMYVPQMQKKANISTL